MLTDAEKALSDAATTLASQLNVRIEGAVKKTQEACALVCDEEFAKISEEADIPDYHRNAWQQCCTRLAMRIREMRFVVTAPDAPNDKPE